MGSAISNEVNELLENKIEEEEEADDDEIENDNENSNGIDTSCYYSYEGEVVSVNECDRQDTSNTDSNNISNTNHKHVMNPPLNDDKMVVVLEFKKNSNRKPPLSASSSSRSKPSDKVIAPTPRVTSPLCSDAFSVSSFNSNIEDIDGRKPVSSTIHRTPSFVSYASSVSLNSSSSSSVRTGKSSIESSVIKQSPSLYIEPKCYDFTDTSENCSLMYSSSSSHDKQNDTKRRGSHGNNSHSGSGNDINNINSSNISNRDSSCSDCGCNAESNCNSIVAPQDGKDIEERQVIDINSFRPFKLLGKGSHGEVFLALDKNTYKPYAIKALCIEDVIQREQVENTLTEIRIHKTLAKRKYPCPFIAPMRYAFHSDTHLFLVFDFMQGGELYRHLCLRGSLPENLAKFYAAEICLAIGYLHAIGVVYRDLKPENLCLDSKGHINLIDLGLCKDGVTSCSSGLNELCGTTEYLAPEILKFSGYGLSADWWSFGMVLYEMLTGLPPWYSNDQSEMIDGILNKRVDIPGNMSENAKDLILKLLDKDPRKRLGGKGGTREVMSHPFFKDIDWVKLAKRGVDSPFVPPNNGADMVQNFDECFTNSKIACLMPCFFPAELAIADEYHKLINAAKFNYESNSGKGKELDLDDSELKPITIG